MQSVTLQDAQAHLEGLIAALKPGEECVITQQGHPVARLVAESSPPRKPRQPGSAVGQLTILAEDDEHLADFKEYMPTR
jgi:prevent-host-death family protein